MSDTMKECHLYKKLKNEKAQCLNCAHYCLIEKNQKGICAVRENQGGKLYSLTYGKPCALAVDPIEKKPFYHFLPRTYSLSIAAVGCNFRCSNCQNWQISQQPKNFPIQEKGQVSPEQIVETALQKALPSISYTYTEPAVFSEYALAIMELAKEKGLKNAWVSNGFWSKELFETMVPYLDAVNIDLKSFSDKFYQKYCGARLKPVLETLKRISRADVHLEITTLFIPSLNDSQKEMEEIASFIKKELGPAIPWHISRFFPGVSWKLKNLPQTPLEILNKAEEIGRRIGLKNIHLGNV